ncbi:O-antigen ligase family protein [Sulfurimonas sp. HSL1-6]|uniref:O-antigen ligase family protein n=1 Tax=Thiomicrolovo immobilis TaxID=3131935 RepID=UPI0031F75FA3
MKKEVNDYFRHYKLFFLLIVIFYFILLASSALFSLNHIASTANSIIKIFGQMFLLLVTVVFVDRGHIDRLIKLILFLQLIVIGLAFLEWQFKQPLFSIFSAFNENLREALASGNYRDTKYRVISTFPHSLVLAQYLLMLLPFNHYYFKYSTSNAKFIYLLNILMTPLILYMTDSRMGMALYILYYFFIFNLSAIKSTLSKKIQYFLKRVLFRLSVLLFILLGIVFIVNFDTYVNNALELVALSADESETTTNSTNARLLQLMIGSEHVSWFGHGSLGTIEIMEQYSMKAMDNYYVSILLNTGIVGLGLSLLFAIVLFNFIIKFWRVHKIMEPFFFFYLNFYLFILILSIDYMWTLYYVFLGLLFIIIKNDNLEGKRISKVI